MAVRFPDMPQPVDPAETHINHFFDHLIECLNQRRFVLLDKARDTRLEMAARPTALARTEQELIEAQAEIERRLQMNVLRETQLKVIGELEEKLAEVRLPHPSTRLVFLANEVFVADCNNHRVQILDESLHFQRSIEHDSMYYPRDVKLTDNEVFGHVAMGGRGGAIAPPKVILAPPREIWEVFVTVAG